MTEQPTVQVTVLRQEPGGEPHRQEFAVPFSPTTTVLDVLDWIKARAEPSLTYRWSCRSAVCGSCGVQVNGQPALACEAFAASFRASGLNIAPLAHAAVQRDLAVDSEAFLARLRSVQPWLAPRATAPANPSAVNRQTPEQLAKYLSLAQCSNCQLCLAACPVFDQTPQFVGPAAVALAERWSRDSRDAGAPERFALLADNEHGIWPCVLNGACSRVCPRGVDPEAQFRTLQRQALDPAASP